MIVQQQVRDRQRIRLFELRQRLRIHTDDMLLQNGLNRTVVMPDGSTTIKKAAECALRQRYANHIQQFANVRRLPEEGGCPCLQRFLFVELGVTAGHDNHRDLRQSITFLKPL